MTDRTNSDGVRRDDTFDDVTAAYRELISRSDNETAEITAPSKAVEGQQTQGETKAATVDSASEGTDRRSQEQKDRDRDEKGRFAAKQPQDDQRGTEQPAAEKAATEQPDASKSATVSEAPPPSWGVKAKAAWDSIPAEVRQEIAKRESEVAQGFAALRDYKDLKPYAEQARQSGTSIAAALDRYSAVDRLMQKDLAGGLAVAAESYGIAKQNMGRFFLDAAKRYGADISASSAPRSEGAPKGGNSEDDELMAVLQPVLAPILSELEALKAHHSSRTEADQNAKVQQFVQELDRFAADPKNVFFSNVESEIARILQLKLVPISGNPAEDLKAAYELAIWQNPETRAALIEKQVAEKQGTQRQKEQEVVDKARQSSKSMGGSRVPGTIYKDALPGKGEPDDVEADVRRAYRQLSQA